MALIDDIATRFDGVRHSTAGGLQCQCPAHDDRQASLSIGTGDDGRILLHCHAGCSFQDILAAVGLKTKDLFPAGSRRSGAGRGDARAERGAGAAAAKAKPARAQGPAKQAAKRGHIVATYDYVNAAGELIFQVCRMEPKSFRQRRPDGAGGWAWNLQGVERVPYRLPGVLAAIARGEWVYIPEGEKDVHSLEALGLTASTNAGGAGKFGAAEAKHFKGARVAILPDNDKTGRKGADQTAAALAGIADEIRIVELPDLPEKGDVTDWIEAGGTAADLAAANKAAAVAAPEDESKSKAKAENPSVIPLDVAEQIAIERPHLIAFAGDYWEFTGKIFEPVTAATITRHMIEIVKTQAKRTLLDDIHYILRAKLEAGADFFDPDPDPKRRRFMLALENGMLDPATGELQPHDAKWRARALLPVAYDAQADCPRFRQALEEWVPEDAQARALLVEWLGLCLVPETAMCSALWLFGEGANGKGRFAKVLENLIGRRNFTAVSAYQLKSDRTFPAAQLDGKLVNFCTEIEGSRELDIGFLKALISGDPVEVERKGRDPFTMTPTARFVFQTNNAPNIKDRSDGFWRRMLMVHFSRQFKPEERDPALDDTLAEELPGILNMALEGLRRLASRGRFLPSAAMMAAVDEYRRECNPLAAWKEEFLRECPSVHAPAKDCFEHYKKWAEESGHKPFSRINFTKELQRLGVSKPEQKWVSGGNIKSFVGWELQTW